MSAWEGSQSQCDLCDGVFGHLQKCPRYVGPTHAPRTATESGSPTGRYRYRGRVYQIVLQARSPTGPVTLETIDEPRETIDTTNDRLCQSEFERLSQDR